MKILLHSARSPSQQPHKQKTAPINWSCFEAVPFLHSGFKQIQYAAVVGIVLVELKMKLLDGDILTGRLEPHGGWGGHWRTAEKGRQSAGAECRGGEIGERWRSSRTA